jgi:hypothetical protein
MKIIYLKASTKDELISDIQKVLPEYNGEIEFGNGEMFGHYIGDLMLVPPVLNENREIITPALMAGFEHANLLVPDDFDESIFEFDGFVPANPKHKFAL